jgi:Kef-type K+ transport system membrane component KefB
MQFEVASMAAMSGRFLLQLGLTIVVSRLVAIVLRWLGQSAVIAEVVAGILLGPTLLGAVSPQAFQWLFPASSLGLLKLFSQVGIALFMFGVGMEFDVAAVRSKGRSALTISFVSIGFPFILGLMLAAPLARTFGGGKPTLVFALFIATAMSITAFPVLARILKESSVAPSIAALTLTGAAVDDVTAWLLLAVVVSLAKGGTMAGAAVTLALVVLFALLMVFVVPRVLARWRDSALMPLLLLAASAGAAELIGVHAVFGAFVAGVVLPMAQEQRRAYRRRIEPLALLFLPLFFALSGLRTELSVLVNASTLIACIAVVTIATAGKLGGGTIAARVCGMGWYDSLTIGVLMNTRGLMELVVLNIGYDLGILDRDLFAIFVVMALVTTFATGPVLRLLPLLQARMLSTPDGETAEI